jgi:hypothetical protein
MEVPQYCSVKEDLGSFRANRRYEGSRSVLLQNRLDDDAPVSSAATIPGPAIMQTRRYLGDDLFGMGSAPGGHN